MKRDTSRVRPQTLVFGVAAAIVVAISVALDLVRADVQPVLELPRFSGSAVVAGLPSLLPSPELPRRLRVMVVRDDAAASYYDSPATLDTIVRAWRDELVAIGADARIVGADALHEERNAHVLVIPSSPCMTLATREAIEAASARGQGLVLTGLAGVYDAGCRRIGFGLIIQATGAARAEVLEPRETVYLGLPSGSPLSADIPPGARIELEPARHVALRHPRRLAYYADYALAPQPANGMPLLDGAVVHAMRGAARIVYWGFELHTVVRQEWNRSIVRLLVRNSVAWAGRAALAWIEPWPHGRRAAIVFMQDVDYPVANSRSSLDSLRVAGAAGTYLMTTEFARRNRRLARQLAATGEIVTPGESGQPLGGASAEVQQSRLRTAQQQMKELLGSAVAGLQPPEEQFDTATMTAWLEMGGRYLFGVNDGRTDAPELLRVGADTLVLISRSGERDFGTTAWGDAETLRASLRAEVERVRALGGLHPFRYSSRLLTRAEHAPVLAGLARDVAGDTTLWVTTAREVAEWWRARASLQVEARSSGDTLHVTVQNRGAATVIGAIAGVALPQARLVEGANVPVLSDDPDRVRLALPPIPAGATLRFAVQLGWRGSALSF